MIHRIKSENHIAFALALIMLIISASGCQGQASPASNLPADQPTSDKLSDFDDARAYAHLKKMVELGPRPPGSAAIKKAQDYIESELESYGLKVIADNFDARTTRGTVAMKNIIAELPGAKSDIIIISGHYDTKPQPGFIGANDGGSSTAAVLEIARALAKTKPEYTLWFVFFDGEEAFIEWSANNGMDNTYGSRHMAAQLIADKRIDRIKAMILVDMIGDKDLDLLRDYESTAWLVDIVWGTAHRIGHGKHFINEDSGYSDDHIPFKQAGVPVIDLIDFNYGPDNSYWHTNEDTLDKTSGESLKIVGDVVIQSLPEISKHLNRSNASSH